MSENGYSISGHVNEFRIAGWLHDNLGGDIKLLKEADVVCKKMPDYIWRGKMWDLKNTTTEKAANSAIRHGLKQIAENPGGIILDYSDIETLSEGLLWEIIEKRMEWSRMESDVDILVLLKGNHFIARRYKKRKNKK